MDHAVETIAIGQRLLDKLISWAEQGVALLPNIAVALIILLLTWVFAGLLARLAERAIKRIVTHPQLNWLLVTTVRLSIWAGGVFMALDVVKLDKTVTSMLAGLGILGLALGFAFQDLATNFMAGVMLALRQPFKNEDIIKTGDHMGVVQGTDLRAVKIKLFTGEIVIVPNKDVFQSALINYNALPHRRVDIEVGVSYGDDLEAARAAVTRALQGVPARLAHKDPEVFFTGFGDSSIDLVARFWIDYDVQPDYLSARSDAVIAIKRALDEADITIPFPIRTLDFGIKGGETLRTQLPSGPRALAS